ncbi:hypothetical protein [Microbacterium hydrocarbonoxydans]|uniref:hypothetical protein n=1 Tax=Microbacterium hydrocarbonoxydans TaxID=273678 RepID=UPI00203E1A2A|nr:hypothetical protein [Microbacterium hydrocarbonoxydans]MCM3779883.1 hypothetical protein [Microbacterium hydrocarbonoxydans]
MAETSSPNPRGHGSAGVSRVLALTLATIGFFALAVFGLGALSVATDADIIAVRGLGQIPGVVGMLAALLAFAIMLWSSLRRQHPSFLSVPTTALAAALSHLIVLWVAVLLARGDLVVATAVAGDLVRGGASAVLLVAAAIAAWAGVALRRTRSGRPRWPWEDEGPE